ncbi:glycosyltransferase family 2 protein [Neobacillus ginsengisoli]|uniref:Glycosyltransferase involved in cell wall biosynthesis n=1 Tax=Neobacillus ginsengisoli TaxID=904295 RepID=A0ABT9XU49_9BACI|nr:glycosyltransferase family 2 protein [Neobacillus ginsengisoli]MDQ0199070.1 glycosyltransferase involved in cell wall biosynthesis [Neobacillus ginsengisoli]
MMLSVCMATYNGAGFVVRQLDTVLKQLGPDDEVIVVDDRSKDNTVQLIKDTYGSRVQVTVNEQNLGAIKSFEKAISLAKGDILFLCDQDDLWEDDKVKTVLTAFEEHNAVLVVHDAYVVDGNLKIINPSWNDYNHNNINQGIFGNILKNAYTGAFMAFKKELVPLILPFPGSIEMHDQWIALVCMMKKKKIVFINQPLMKYVRHGGNVTGMKKRSLATQLKGRLRTISAITGFKR